MKAADQGLADAQLALGVLFATGQGVIRDHDKAVAWYMKAAEQGQVDAQFNLGVLLATGMVHGGIIVRLSPGSGKAAAQRRCWGAV